MFSFEVSNVIMPGNLPFYKLEQVNFPIFAFRDFPLFCEKTLSCLFLIKKKTHPWSLKFIGTIVFIQQILFVVFVLNPFADLPMLIGGAFTMVASCSCKTKNNYASFESFRSDSHRPLHTDFFRRSQQYTLAIQQK